MPGQENDSGQSKNDGFMNNERLYDMIDNLNQKQNELILEVRKNNHIKDEVAELKTKVNENTECLNTMLDQEKGKKSAINDVVKTISLLGSGATIALGIGWYVLQYLGVL